MMGKGGCGQRRGNNQFDRKGKVAVSDFIDEYNGYLALSDQEYVEARPNHTGLWKNTRFLLKYGF
jgi:hypothetical protein